MEKPLLQFYADETWGYDTWDEENKRKEGIRVKFQQEEDETREGFFKRLGLRPNPNMYGSDLKKDKNVRNKNWLVRFEVARQGYGLDILVHDEYYDVREVVAGQGYGLDILVQDEVVCVRMAVAEQGCGLDVLVHDENCYVREAVAWQGFGLDILVHDEDEDVRAEVARQGYGLDVLAHDKHKWVRKAVEDYLKKYDYPSVEAWIEENPKKCADKKNRK